MITKIINGKILVGSTFLETDLFLEDRTVLGVGKDLSSFDRVVDAEGNYVTPGLIDLHCHGGGGCDFSDGTVEAVRTAARVHLKKGTTTLFPTVLSTDPAVMESAIVSIEKARDIAPSLAGIHLEGPYFSSAQSGAQNKNALRKPCAAEYRAILEKHRIARWDYAPELDEDRSFLRTLLFHGVLPAAAHTDATCDTMLAAAEEGCRLITHLYSCTSTIRRERGFRIAGVVEAAYLSDEISAELIADGCHLPPSLLRLAYRLKGADRLALVTDGMRAAGTETQGACDIGGVSCVIEDGVAKLPDRSAFAGSIATADRLLRTVVSAGIPLTDGVKMLTRTPACLMGLSRKGEILPGNDADLVIFDETIQIKAVFLQGEIVE